MFFFTRGFKFLALGAFFFSTATFGYQRIISLSPASTECLFALGESPSIVGVTSACNFPKEAQSLPQIGGFLTPNIEKITALSPEFVVGIGDELGFSQNQLKTLHIACTLYPSPHSIQDILTILNQLGTQTGHPEKSTALVKKIKQNLSQLKRPQKRPRVLVLLWASPFISVGTNTFISDIIDQAGGQNCVRSQLDYPKITPETLLRLDPDYLILTDPKLLSMILSIPALKKLKAIQTNHVITSLDPDTFLRPGPRCVTAIITLNKLFL